MRELVRQRLNPLMACLPLARRAVDEGTNPDTFAVQLFRDSLAANQARCAGRAGAAVE